MNALITGLPEAVALRLIDLVNVSMQPGGKYDPFTAENFGEALTEASLEQHAKVASLVRANDPVAVIAALHLIAREYWFDYACTLLTEDAYEQVESYNPAARESWELPTFLQYQAH